MSNNIEIYKDDVQKIVNIIQKDILLPQKIFDDFSEIVNNNSKLQKENPFHEFIKFGYLYRVLMNIRKQSDPHGDSFSLYNLLLSIWLNCKLFTKESFLQFYDENSRDLGINEFERHFGNLEYLDPMIVYDDMQSILSYDKKVKKITNSIIAHHNKKSIQSEENIQVSIYEINQIIRKIENISKKYLLLFTGATPSHLLPTRQDDYKWIFKIPWIEKDE